MGRPGPDPALVQRARDLAAGGMTQAQAAAELGVPARTLREWGVGWPQGRPRVPGGHESARTARRRRAEEETGIMEFEAPETVVRAIARTIRAMEPRAKLVTRDGDGPVIMAAMRLHGDRHHPDLGRPCGDWPDGDGWAVRVSSARAASTLARDMWLPDENMATADGRRAEIEAAAAASFMLVRECAREHGMHVPPIPGDDDYQEPPEG